MIWLYLGAFAALVVFGIDLLLRRKKWSSNTPEEKRSLILGMVLMPVYLFTSGLGLLMGIVPSDAEGGFGDMLYEVALRMGFIIFIPCTVATLGSIVLRKLGKEKGAKRVHYFAVAYIALTMLLWLTSGCL